MILRQNIDCVAAKTRTKVDKVLIFTLQVTSQPSHLDTISKNLEPWGY